MWVVRGKLPKASPNAFYEKLDKVLNDIGFARAIRGVCGPAYADEAKGGRPGIDPAVYFKMLMVGFFENLPSERAIASRCADSLSLRAFLGYSIEEATPDHSSLGVIRKRLSAAMYQQCHEVVLRGLREHGLLKGRDLGIDSSIIEANASLRALEQRNSGKAYWDYVKELAAEAGVDPEDAKAVRRFDRKRKGRKTSNKEWVNPHDPDAKVGKTKHGATDMVYKPEHVTDLESGVIVRAEVRAGDAGDTEGLVERTLEATEVLSRVCDDPGQGKVGRSLTADEGCFSAEGAFSLQSERIRAVIGDPHGARRNNKDKPRLIRQALGKAKRAVRSKSGKALLRKRGEHLERSFAHVLDHGGLRRATVRGLENLSKKQVGAVMAFNLSVLMRHKVGKGTPKQWLAGVAGAFCRHMGGLLARFWTYGRRLTIRAKLLQRRGWELRAPQTPVFACLSGK